MTKFSTTQYFLYTNLTAIFMNIKDVGTGGVFIRLQLKSFPEKMTIHVYCCKHCWDI